MNSFNAPEPPKVGGDPVQLQLWDSPPLNPIQRLKTAMRDALKGCPASRTKVVGDINELARREGMTCNGRTQEVTEDKLDKWVAAGAEDHVIPVKYFVIFCRVTGSMLPLQALAACLEAEILAGDDRKVFLWGKAEIERKKLTKRASILAQEVGLK